MISGSIPFEEVVNKLNLEMQQLGISKDVCRLLMSDEIEDILMATFSLEEKVGFDVLSNMIEIMLSKNEKSSSTSPYLAVVQEYLESKDELRFAYSLLATLLGSSLAHFYTDDEGTNLIWRMLYSDWQKAI
jgi:hypothetical protein